MKTITKFSEKTINELKSYVYKLIDPRDGKVFYVGKGKGNRVFSHMNLTNEFVENIDTDNKTDRIRAILNEGLEVIAIIHRHGMDETTAYEVEAALIDEYDNLTNIQSGHGSNDYGPMNVNQIEQVYCAETLKEEDFDENDKILLIKIKEAYIKNNNNDIYKTVHYAWAIGENRKKVKHVAAVVNGIIKKMYLVDEWYYVEERNRWAFNGREVELSKYINKRIPASFRRKGNASPFIYTFKTK